MILPLLSFSALSFRFRLFSRVIVVSSAATAAEDVSGERFEEDIAVSEAAFSDLRVSFCVFSMSSWADFSLRRRSSAGRRRRG